MWRMATLSVDLRERILASYDNGEGTRDEIARRYRVSLGMVKKLLQQRRHRGDIRPQHHRSGRKPKILAEHRRAMREALCRKPDLTLSELRDEVKLDTSLVAIHLTLVKMGLTYKKRRSVPASKTAPTSSRRGGAGSAAKAASSPRGLSSSTKRVRRPT